MANENINAEAAYKTILTVWAALLMSQFLLTAMVLFIKPELLQLDLRSSLLGDEPLIVILFAIGALSCLVIGQVLRRRNLEQAVNEQKISLVQTAVIIACAFAEVSTLLGLVLAFAFNYRYFLIFVIVGVIGMLLAFPKRSDVHAASYKTQ